jgi:D-3-phosphoglycerate dehydrogenase
VGTSRTHLFDADALAAALTDGRIEACMLDGAEAGFASRGSALHDLSNLFLTPRIGSHTRESRLRASWYVAHRIHETLAAPRITGLDQMASGPAALEGAPQFIVR